MSLVSERFFGVVDRTSRSKIGWTLAATSFGFVVVQLDVTIVNVAIAPIGASLGSSVTGLQWIVDAYTLAFAALLLTAGSFGDRFGSRRVFTVGLVLFGLASFSCAISSSLASLIAARVAQGIGAALILPTSLALLTHASAEDAGARTRAIAWWSSIGGLVSAAGPTLGGLLTTSLGWRSIFIVNLPVCVMGLWACRRYVEETPAVATQKLDPSGQLLAVLTFFLLTHSVIDAGARGWTEPGVLAGFAAAIGCSIAFVYNEHRVTAPMLPLRLFREKVFSAAIVLGVIMNVTFYGSIFVLSLYFQHARGYTPTRTGLALLPFIVIMPANLLSAKLAQRFSPRATVIAGFVISGLAFGGLHGIGDATPYWRIFPSLLLLAIGGGVGTPALTSSMLGSVERTRTATASATFNAARQVGSAIGVALFGAFLSGTPATMAAGAVRAFDLSALLRLAGAMLAALCL